MIAQLIEKFERVAADERQPEDVRAAARTHADGFRAALAAKQAKK